MTTTEKTYRLTATMVEALLGVIVPRSITTVRALVARDLVTMSDTGHGWFPTEEGHRVIASLRAERYGEPDTVPSSDPADEDMVELDESGVLYPECESAGAHCEADHEPQDCGWPVLAVEEPSTVIAREISAGDVIVFGGDRRRVLGTWTYGSDVVLHTAAGRLSMAPGTPVRVDRNAPDGPPSDPYFGQLSLSDA